MEKVFWGEEEVERLNERKMKKYGEELVGRVLGQGDSGASSCCAVAAAAAACKKKDYNDSWDKQDLWRQLYNKFSLRVLYSG